MTDGDSVGFESGVQQTEAPCWNCGTYTVQKIGSVAHFCTWNCAVLWNDGKASGRAEA